MASFIDPSRTRSLITSRGAIVCLAMSLTTASALVACGDDTASGGAAGTSDAASTGSAPSGSSTTGAQTSGSTSSGTSASGSTTGTATSSTTTTASQTSASITVGTLMSCGEAGLMDCFSSYECAMEDRCEDQGTPDASVPCCVPGMRGPGLAGDECTGEADCQSSLCVEIDNGPDICTDSCDDLGDCPSPFQHCTTIAGSGSPLMFCLL